MYQCRTNTIWTNTGIKARNYISVIVGGNITIGENGNWFCNGKDTGIPSTPAVNEQLDNINLQLQQHNKILEQQTVINRQLDNKIQTSQKEIEEAQKNYEKKEELLKARLVAVYESGETSYLDVLLGSESLIDLISNYYLVSEIVISDEELLEEIQKQKEILVIQIYV